METDRVVSFLTRTRHKRRRKVRSAKLDVAFIERISSNENDDQLVAC